VLQPIIRADDPQGFLVVPRRWVVARTLAWLTQWRRLSTEDEVLPARSEAMISIAMPRVMIRRLAAA
jgi:transposase